MNKKLVIIVIVLLLLGVGAFFMFKSKKGSNSGISPVTSGAQSVKDLIAAGIPQKCTFTSTEGGASTQGTTYVAAGKVRGDFGSTIDGKASVSHMISDGETTYIWQDGQMNGVKMEIPKDSQGEASTQPVDTSVGKQADLDQKMDYDCSAWIPDTSLFSPPSDVTFTDLSQMYTAPTNTTPGTGSNGGSQCSYCDALTGDDKTQCLAAFNCN